MSYRVRYKTHNGSIGHWMRDYATREEAQRAIDGRVYDTGFAYFVEEVPDVSTAAVPDASPDPTASQWPGQPAPEKPTSTTERLVRLLRDRHARGLAKYGTTLDRTDLTPEQWAQHAIEEALDLAGYLMRLKDGCGQEPGSTAAHHVEILRARVKELEVELAKAKQSLAKAPSVPVGASEAPREGGDSGSSSFEALEAFLRADTCRSIQAIEDGRFIVLIPGYIGSPASRTLKGISASVEQMVKCESKWLLPISRPKREFGEGTNLWRLNALERFLDGDDAASLTWHEGEFHAIAEGEAITAPTLAALADKLMEKKEAKP